MIIVKVLCKLFLTLITNLNMSMHKTSSTIKLSNQIRVHMFVMLSMLKSQHAHANVKVVPHLFVMWSLREKLGYAALSSHTSPLLTSTTKPCFRQTFRELKQKKIIMHLDNNYFWISNNKTPCEGIERRKEFQLKHDKAGERKYSTDMFYIVQK